MGSPRDLGDSDPVLSLVTCCFLKRVFPVLAAFASVLGNPLCTVYHAVGFSTKTQSVYPLSHQVLASPYGSVCVWSEEERMNICAHLPEPLTASWDGAGPGSSALLTSGSGKAEDRTSIAHEPLGLTGVQKGKVKTNGCFSLRMTLTVSCKPWPTLSQAVFYLVSIT